MYKTNIKESNNNMAVGIDQLRNMLGVGKCTADKIGREAGAVIHMGRRKLFNVKKVQEYLDQKAEEGR